jgi:hypothetical protein
VDLKAACQRNAAPREGANTYKGQVVASSSRGEPGEEVEGSQGSRVSHSSPLPDPEPVTLGRRWYDPVHSQINDHLPVVIGEMPDRGHRHS